MEQRVATGRAERRAGIATLVIDRVVAAPVEAVWRALTTPEGLEPWIGTYSGDPATGTVAFRMTAEDPDAAPTPCRIRSCDTGRELDAEIEGPEGMGNWRLRVVLAGDDASTRVEFSQPLEDAESASSIGPGWEYYLDRLAAQVEGRQGESFDWESYYPAQAAHYRTAFEQLGTE